MSWIKTVVTEIWGLFVDDGAFALSILLWLAIAAALPRLPLPTSAACFILFAGFAGLLIYSARRRATKL
jgi:hypothetical protein